MATKKKTNAALDPAEQQTYRVLSALDHDGQRYEADEQIDLDTAAAEPLLRVGVIQQTSGADE